jgi:multidrug efflux pump subunit AcrA (membrane-fusion protein)
MTPSEAIDLLAKYAYRCAEYDSALRHRDAEAAIKAQADAAVTVLRNALAERQVRFAQYYVTDLDGRRVSLIYALTELGIISDGGK